MRRVRVLWPSDLTIYRLAMIYELLDRALGLPVPAEGYQFRNVQLEVWRNNLEEQKKADAARAQKLQDGASEYCYSFRELIRFSGQRQETYQAITRRICKRRRCSLCVIVGTRKRTNRWYIYH